MSPEPKTLFAGTFERSMDAKKRVSIPSAWLGKKEGEEFYVVLHPRKEFLMVMLPAELVSWEEKFLSDESKSMAQRRAAVRRFYAGAHRVLTDGQGRILLPEEHCEAVGLTNAVVFLGGRSRFEIWDKERHTASIAAQDDDYLNAAEDIGL